MDFQVKFFGKRFEEFQITEGIVHVRDEIYGPIESELQSKYNKQLQLKAGTKGTFPGKIFEEIQITD